MSVPKVSLATDRLSQDSAGSNVKLFGLATSQRFATSANYNLNMQQAHQVEKFFECNDNPDFKLQRGNLSLV